MGRIEWRELGVHGGRVAASLAVLVLLRGQPALALVAAVALYIAVFAFNHDVAHGALGLPARLNALLLGCTGLLMGISGHAMRRMHLRHHAHPLANDDVEGAGARVTLLGALALGPMNAAVYRVEALRTARGLERRAQIVETVLALGLTLAALATRSIAGAAWVVANVTMMLTAAAWASHLPHRPPRWLKALALELTWTHSAAVLSFAFHDEHHVHPKIPCGRLA